MDMGNENVQGLPKSDTEIGERRSHRHLRKTLQKTGIRAEMTAEGELTIAAPGGTTRLRLPESLRPLTDGTPENRGQDVLIRLFSDAARYDLLCGDLGEPHALSCFADRWNRERWLVETVSGAVGSAAAALNDAAMRDLGLDALQTSAGLRTADERLFATRAAEAADDRQADRDARPEAVLKSTSLRRLFAAIGVEYAGEDLVVRYVHGGGHRKDGSSCLLDLKRLSPAKDLTKSMRERLAAIGDDLDVPSVREALRINRRVRTRAPLQDRIGEWMARLAESGFPLGLYAVEEIVERQRFNVLSFSEDGAQSEVAARRPEFEGLLEVVESRWVTCGDLVRLCRDAAGFEHLRTEVEACAERVARGRVAGRQTVRA